MEPLAPASRMSRPREEERSQRLVTSRESRHRGVKPLAPGVAPKVVSCLCRPITMIYQLDHFDHTLVYVIFTVLAGLELSI